ncbi:hypothetical protein BDV36DRAFT_273157 [Aspergillus pseudocaelatus]|uniref:Uncharacterized protein n=1 Tax=Aspergillus pseudocaelatus TaxID=1825620 RepID=A0ABQ6W423_9EURO|nr:hypothetical protein BDV36DRAFT_273157 [Aspergillus pseudocaelatus]
MYKWFIHSEEIEAKGNTNRSPLGATNSPSLCIMRYLRDPCSLVVSPRKSVARRGSHMNKILVKRSHPSVGQEGF